jgi:TPP-dependent pyruvate/acetoin dehydrogenase alpha subunit
VNLLTTYGQMLRVRRFEEQLLALLKAGELVGSAHLCIGQEAIPVGACSALQFEDAVVATYRGHGWAIARGAPLDAMFAEVLGRDSELCGGRGGSAYLMAPAYGFLGENSIVGAGVPMAVGAALARKLQPGGDRAIAVVSIGDGAMNQGNVHESLNMAAVLELPLLVIVENNGYAEMTPADALTAVPAHVRAAGYGIEALVVDGNDPVSVAESVARARSAIIELSKPVLIEAMTRRLVGHYSGDVQAYRPAGELEAAWRADPIEQLALRIGDAAAVASARGEVEVEMAAALEAARAVPFAETSGVGEHLYAAANR